RRRARLPTEPVLPGLRARALKAWLRFAAEGLLVAFLALHAPQRSRKRLQALENDVAAAVEADAVAALLDALARRLQSPELVQVARQVGLLQIGEQRGDRFIARVGCRPGVLGIGLLARTRRVLAQLGEQHVAPLIDLAAQLLGLLLCQRHDVSLHFSLDAMSKGRSMPCQWAGAGGAQPLKS